MKVSKAPVCRSGRCYAYLSLTDFGLTCHLNNRDKVQKPASSFFPLLTTLSRYFLCPGLFPLVLMEMTSIVRALTVSFSWLATVHRAFTAPTQPSDSPVLVPLWAQSELKSTNFWRAGPALRQLQFAESTLTVCGCGLPYRATLRLPIWKQACFASRHFLLPYLASSSIDSIAADLKWMSGSVGGSTVPACGHLHGYFR